MNAPRLTVVYVGGCGRSGSTLLDRLLGALPGVVAVGELVHLVQRGLIEDEACGCGRPFHECPFWGPVTGRALGGLDAADLRRLQASVDRNRHALRMLVPALAGGHADDQRRWATVVGSLLHEAAAEAGATVVVDSSKHASTAYLMRLVPDIDLRIVHLVRDARGMAHSWTRAVARPEARSTARATMRRHPPWKSAGRWVAYNAMFETLRALTAVPVTRVAYEDLVAHPRRELDRICSGAGLDVARDFPFLHDDASPATASLEPGHSVAGNPMRFSSGDIPLRLDAAWRSEMTRTDRLAVTAIGLPLLAAYGYLGGGR